MTYTFTHLSLEGLAVWNLLPKKVKSYYREHRWEFLFINLFAILPDVDILFGYHRSYTHSIIIPTVMLLAIFISEAISKATHTYEESTQRFFRFVKLSMLMWVIHIFLDFGWGALMLFWPITNNFYDLTVFLRFENKPWLFIPLTFLGIIPHWTLLSFEEGVNTFFINLSQAEREQIYGHYIDFYIETIMLHVLIFIVWFIVIFVPIFYKTNKGTLKHNKLAVISRVFIKVVSRQVTVLGAFIIILGLMLGPMIGNSYQNTYDINVELKATTSYFDPTLGVEISLPSGASSEIIYNSEVGRVNYTTTVLLTDNESFYYFFNNFESISEAYLNATINYTTLISQYKTLVQKVKSEAYLQIELKGSKNQEGIKISFEDNSPAKVYFLALVSEWNITESFVYNVNLKITHTYDRSRGIVGGMVLATLGTIIIIADQLSAIKNVRKGVKSSTTRK